MSRIGVVIISYNADPESLFTSMLPSKHDVRSYVFLHGHDAGLKAKLEAIMASINSRYFPYGVNRGVSRSWNEGLHADVCRILAPSLPSGWTPVPPARSGQVNFISDRIGKALRVWPSERVRS